MYQTYHLIQNRYFLTQYANERAVNCVDFQKPVRIAAYAVRKGQKNNRELAENVADYNVKYSLDEFKKQMKLDLKLRFEPILEEELIECVPKSSGRLDLFLEVLLKNRNIFSQSTNNKTDPKLASLNCDFVCYRGTLTHLLTCQYVEAQSFIVYAELFKDTIYLQYEEFEDVDYSQVLPTFIFGGHRFKQFCTKEFGEDEKSSHSSPSEPRKPGERLLETEKTILEDLEEFKEHLTKEFCCVFSNQINEHSLIYSADMDCFEEYTDVHEYPLNSDRLKAVSLKTTREIPRDTKREINFRKFKTVRWWAQAALVNASKVTVGYWKKDHVVDEITEYSLDDLVAIGDWNPRICFYQLASILSFIKRSFASNEGTNKLQFVHKMFSKKILCQQSSVAVVPDFYKKEFN